ncbi:protein big brother-like isoform X2 [Argiope bruennichi]|uniref:Protein big brother like protein n=1 Tax=Argiope bruennichi TaxID=94029 RepID=A0A8T0EV25_ARGBR|nr:protein big brother-like isoform X2 [Argiope bruennichi]KAF8777879.1 Protein big brother like protein [Argiope bruennichi]
MLPFETTNLFEQLPRFVFKMPRVVADQESKFQSDELFRRLSRETEVRYTGYRDRPVEERQMRFQTACREGHTEVSFIATGTNLQLMFSPCSNGYSEGCDFNKEQGKVHIKSCFIMNGVCVRWRGWLDIERLDGVGCLEYDEERAQIEDAILREQLERYNQRVRDFEEKQRLYRSQHDRHVEAEVEARKKQSELSPDRAGSASN